MNLQKECEILDNERFPDDFNDSDNFQKLCNTCG